MKYKKPLNLNLGCGSRRIAGTLGMDAIKTDATDLVHDLNKGLKMFKDGEVDSVYAIHFLEHVDNYIFLMEEIWRVLKNGGKLYVEVPFFAHANAFTDPTHKRFFTISSFIYFDKNNYCNFYSSAPFKMVKRKLIFPGYLKFLEYIFNVSPMMQKIHEKIAFIFPALELHFVLEKWGG
ncbi:MAG: methyltransferase domain-containing protein [Candidatus Aenigmarchaeota archaeon]|nr:methyltransferase domain-containing protein [Candidatus Aenigmarchaeota archaeon]